MFENLTSPEFMALMVLAPKQPAPLIIGYTFQRKDGTYYAADGGVTLYADQAHVYLACTVEAVTIPGGWGNKQFGTFRAVYQREGEGA